MVHFLRTFALTTAMVLSSAGVQAVPTAAAPAGKSPLNSMAPGFSGANGVFTLPPDLHSNPSQQVPPEILEKLRGGGNSDALQKRGLELKRQLDENPSDAYVMHALATVIFYQGDERAARALWAAASKREPNLASAELMTAVQGMFVSLATGDQSNAGKQLAAIEKKFAKDPHFQLMRGEQAMQAGNLQAAEAAYRRAYALAPKLYVSNLNLARFLDLARNDAAAAGPLYLKASQLAPRRPEVWTNYGVFLLRQNQADKALAAFRKAQALDANAPLPEKRLGDLSVSLGRYEDARRWYLAAQEQKPSATEAQAIRVALGNVLLRLNRYAEARKEIEAALEVQELPPLFFALATIDEAEGKTQAAEARYRQILKLTPGNPLAGNNLAMLLIKSGGNAVEALKLAGEARSAIPNNAIIESTWGCALVANGRNGDAIKVLEAVAKVAPDDVWVHYCLAKGLIAEQRSKDAMPHLKQVLQLDARFPRRDEVNKLLTSLR